MISSKNIVEVAMEKWDLYDRERRLTGEVITRGDDIPKERYHLVIHVCIFNSKNEMLIQQRQPFKKGWSHMWDLTVGGSAQAGDTSVKAAEREVFEELGYKVNLSNARPVLTVPFPVGYDDIYFIEDDVKIEELDLQYEEVKQVKWATKDEILRMIDQEEFIPYHKSLIDLLFDLRLTKDAHSNFKNQK